MLTRHFSHLDPAPILTIGDSPNDAPRLNPAHFPQSVGGCQWAALLRSPPPPAYLTIQPEGFGFGELLNHLLQLRSNVV